MDNQQPSTVEERITRLTYNAIVGDGQIWKHPECVNRKLIFTSTTPELLEYKRKIAPEIFTTGVRKYSAKKHRGRYANAKPMYRLASIVHPIITKIGKMSKEEVIQKLDKEDFGLWYLDDGCSVERSDYPEGKKGYRYMICIGDSANTEKRKKILEDKLEELYGKKYGSIYKNNSLATEDNKNWFIPVRVAREQVLPYAYKDGILSNKFKGYSHKKGEGSTTIP